MEPRKLVHSQLPVALAEELQLVASADSSSVSAVVCDAVTNYIKARKKDPEFRRNLQAYIEKASSLIS